MDCTGQVKGEVEDSIEPLDPFGHLPSRLGGCRQVERVSGIAVPKDGHQGASGHYFADRHPVQPDRGRCPGIDLGWEPPPALGQSPAVLPVADHRHQQSRRGQHGIDDDRELVEQIHLQGGRDARSIRWLV